MRSFENGPAYQNGYGDGPRGTPTIDGDALYALSGEGDLACLEVASGKKLWTINILKKFKGKTPGWGISESSFGGLSSGILGSLESFTALMVLIPERHVAVVVMTNVGEEGSGKATVIGTAKRIVSELASPAP